jgi:hypothetical protein
VPAQPDAVGRVTLDLGAEQLERKCLVIAGALQMGQQVGLGILGDPAGQAERIDELGRTGSQPPAVAGARAPGVDVPARSRGGSLWPAGE